MDDSQRHTLTVYGTALLGSALAAELPYALLGRSPDLDVSLTIPAVIASSVMFAVALLASWRCNSLTEIMLLWPVGLGGIGAAVFADAVYDLVVNHHDRNLFPFEIAVIAVLALPGAAVGTVVGAVAGRDRRRQFRLRIPGSQT